MNVNSPTLNMTGWKTINVGFTPKCVIFIPQQYDLYNTYSNGNYYSVYLKGGIFGVNMPLKLNPSDNSAPLEFAKITNNGFMIRNVSYVYKSGELQRYYFYAEADKVTMIYRWAAFK